MAAFICIWNYIGAGVILTLCSCIDNRSHHTLTYCHYLITGSCRFTAFPVCQPANDKALVKMFYRRRKSCGWYFMCRLIPGWGGWTQICLHVWLALRGANVAWHVVLLPSATNMRTRWQKGEAGRRQDTRSSQIFDAICHTCATLDGPSFTRTVMWLTYVLSYQKNHSQEIFIFLKRYSYCLINV